MCQARDHCPGADKRFAQHEQLDKYNATSQGMIMKAAGGTPKTGGDTKMQERIPEVQRAKNRFLLRSMLVLASCLVLNQMGLFVPIVMITRNCISPKVPITAKPKYPQCSDSDLAKEM